MAEKKLMNFSLTRPLKPAPKRPGVREKTSTQKKPVEEGRKKSQ